MKYQHIARSILFHFGYVPYNYKWWSLLIISIKLMPIDAPNKANLNCQMQNQQFVRIIQLLELRIQVFEFYIVSSAKTQTRQTIKKETEVSPRLINVISLIKVSKNSFDNISPKELLCERSSREFLIKPTLYIAKNSTFLLLKLSSSKRFREFCTCLLTLHCSKFRQIFAQIVIYS